jgi:hypothetical protein
MGGKFGYPDCVFTGGSGKVHVYGPNSIADGQWHHIVCTLTSSVGAIWDNGVLGQTQSGSVGSIANTVPVTIGGKPNFSHYYRGNLDEVSITIG